MIDQKVTKTLYKFRIGHENCDNESVMEKVEFKTALERDKSLDKLIIL